MVEDRMVEVKMIIWTVILLQLTTIAHATTIFQDCGSAYALESVEIQGCGRQLPCYITLGEETPVNIYFYADFSSLLFDQAVVININYISTDADVTPDSCEVVVCPVPTDCLTTFSSVLSVPKRMALNQRGQMRWQVYNERGQLVLCYSVLVQTQSRLQRTLRSMLGPLGQRLADQLHHPGPAQTAHHNVTHVWDATKKDFVY